MGTEDTIENILMPNFTGNTDAIDSVDELAPAFTRKIYGTPMHKHHIESQTSKYNI